MHAHIGFDGTPDAPQSLDTQTSFAQIQGMDLGVAPDGTAAASWHVAFPATLRFASGTVGTATWGAATDVPNTDGNTTGAGNPSVFVGPKTVYLTYRSCTPATCYGAWAAMRYDTGAATWGAPFQLWTPDATSYTPAAVPTLTIAQNGDAIVAGLWNSPAGNVLTTATNVGGTWTSVPFPNQMKEGFVTMLPDTLGGLNATLYFRRNPGDVYRATFDAGAGAWTEDGSFKLVSDLSGQTVFSAQLGIMGTQLVAGRMWLYFHDVGVGSSLGGLSIYRSP